MSKLKLIYNAEKPYTEDINDLVEKGGEGSGVRGHRSQRGQPMPGSGSLLEKIRAARHRHKMETDPKKKEKHAKDIRDGVAAYERLNPHLKD